jgi:dTDP-4-amino-4,6-dideoxy-D-galactose acyltransferase
MLPWDSEFFGFRIARVCKETLTKSDVKLIVAWCRQNGVRCLYFLARTDDAATMRLAEDNGFRLVDIRVTLVCDMPARQSAAANGGIVMRMARTDDTGALESIARGGYEATRFHFDKNFPRDRATALYETWIRRSCEGYAQAVLVAEYGGVPAGYITCHLDAAQRAGRIGLTGVHGQTQELGIGHALVSAALNWFATHNVTEVSVATQGRNFPAQRLYQRCGFLTRDVKLWYHKWYDISDASSANNFKT